MRDHHHTSFKVLEGFRERIHTLDIQVVGGFIENKDVGVGQRQARERNTRFLTSRQKLHALETGHTSNTKAKR